MNKHLKLKLVFLLALVIPFFSCAKDKEEENTATYGQYVPEVKGTKLKESQVLNTQDSKVTFESMQKYFIPDYTPEVPDTIIEVSASSSSKTSKNQKTSDAVVPGLRDLANYKTKYNTQRKDTTFDPNSILPNNDDNSNPTSSSSFEVAEWGPKTIVAENQNPSFYVTFTKPVKTLTALGAPEKTSSVMSIEPEIEGVFRWYGTDYISFEASKPAEPGVTYTIKLNKNLKSLSGDKLKGATSFKVEAQPVTIKKLYGGFTKEGEQKYDSSTGAVPPYENRFLVIFSHLLTDKRAQELLNVKVNNKPVKYSLEGWYDKLPFYAPYPPTFIKSDSKTNSYVVTIKDSVPHGATVTANINTNESSASYYTLQPFKVLYTDNYANYSSGNMGNPYRFTLSQPPKLQSLVENLKVNIDYTLTKDNIKVSGREVTIYNLPLEPAKEYQLTIGSNLEDIYGQKLSNKEPQIVKFSTRDVASYVKYLDYGARIMEAQFPHKIIYEHQNILDNSYYVLSNSLDPLQYKTYWSNSKLQTVNDTRYEVQPGPKNQRSFVEVDLDPFLTNGFGWVNFEAHTYVKSEYREEGSDNQVGMGIQVTDLGVTARIGINKLVVMVRTLSKNKSVENAKITLNDQIKGTTDSNGLCVINFNQNEIDLIENIHINSNFKLLVESGDDKVIFIPNSHSPWRHGVSRTNLSAVRKARARTFMFVDRGVYKPGETVTFRGIDRDQILGTLKPVQTDYVIWAQENYYNSLPITNDIRGTTTESGGFYGSFQIPEDLKGGTYTIYYKRVGSSEQRTCTFLVANFERLNFETVITAPETKYYGGNQVSATINANYLAGGALSGAEYYASWFKKPIYFTPNTPETKGYEFSTYDYNDYNQYWSDTKGNLDASGQAEVTCVTQPITNGRPYSYKLETYVTDISNQRIAASKDIIVHPATYYIGIAKPEGVSGYPKKGTQLKFPLLLVDTNGNALSQENVKKELTSLSYTLTREEYTLVNENSVDDSIYTRYELKTIKEQEGTISVTQAKNTLSIKPSQSGWYTLTVSGFDSQKNEAKSSYEFFVTGGRSFWFDSYNEQSLKLTPDKNQYNPGETAQILLESPLPEGDYLITVEREGIFTEEIRHFDTPANVIEVPIATNYVPVIYVSVSSYSIRNGPPTYEYGEVDLDKPKGYYGVTSVFVNPQVRSFTVKIETDKPSYKPGEQATVTLTATRGGEPISNAELTLMAVDRGILDIVDYHVPNPIDFFYDPSYFALGVTGGDNRGMIMDPVTYSIKNLAGGDAEETKDENERKDFRPTAVFEPELVTDSQGKVSCTFTMPDTLTTYRITAFGVKNDYFALRESEVKVQNPVNVQAVKPRRLRERDTAECGVLITNLQPKGLEVTVEASVISPTKNTVEDEREGRTTVPGKAFIDGETKHKVYVAPGDSTVVYFDVAAQQAGTVEVNYSIKSSVLNEKLVSTIKIEKTYVYETVALMGQTEGGKNKAVSRQQIAIPSFAKDSRGDIKITLDATRLGLLGSSVNYLFEYPYGCMEQQASRVLPLVLFNEYIDIFDMDSKVTNVKKCVTSFTKEWKNVQLENGGFPYWPDNTNANLYVSTYLAQIYGEAKKRGYTDNELSYNIESLCSYIAKEIKDSKDKLSNAYELAFACYVLKLNQSSLLDAELDLLYNNLKSQNLSTCLYTALAFAEGGNAKKAQEIADSLSQYLKPSGQTVTVIQKESSSRWSWYDNNVSQLALYLKLYASLNPNEQMVDRLVITLLQRQKKGYWSSTVTTSNVLNAIYTYIKMRNLDETKYTATVSIGDKQVMKESFKSVADKPKTLVLPFESKTISSLQKDAALPVIFEKDGNGYLFYNMQMRYALPDEVNKARDEGINITYLIKDFETGQIITTENPNSCSLMLETGKVYEATVRINSSKDLDYVAVRCPIPSGAEILDSALVTSGSQAQIEGYFSNKDVRDNEIQFFWDTFRSGTKTVKYRFRTARRGVYPTPPIQAECMYQEEIFGRSDGYLMQIK